MTEAPVLMPQPLGMYAAELFQRSTDYFEAFERLAGSPGRELSFPMYFLFAHGLELGLKAFLAAKGTTKRELFKLGHKLQTIYEHCVQNQMPAVIDLDVYVASFQEMNRDHDFRYPSGYNLSVAAPSHCIAIACQFKAALGPIISFAHVTSVTEYASNTRHLKGKKIRWSD